MRISLKTPQWQSQVDQTIQKVKRESKSRSLKSSDIYECICIFISDHLNKRIFSYATLSLYYQHMKSFSAQMTESEKITDIRKVNVFHLRRHFSARGDTHILKQRCSRDNNRPHSIEEYWRLEHQAERWRKQSGKRRGFGCSEHGYKGYKQVDSLR